MADITHVDERWTGCSGVRIRYLDNAPDEQVGLPVLLSPGLSDFADEYVEVLEFLAPRRVLAVDFRGRGGSEAPVTGYAAADHVTDLRAVLDEEGIERFHLMTFSRGTTWGLDVALADPGRAASVAIGDYWAREKGLDVTAAERVTMTRFRGRPMPDRVAAHVPHECSWPRAPRPVRRAGGRASPCAGGHGERSRDACWSLCPCRKFRDRIPDVEIAAASVEVVGGAGVEAAMATDLRWDAVVQDPLVGPAGG